MKTQLLIATGDNDYAEHLSKGLSELHADVIDVSVCGSEEHLREQLKARKFDVALLESTMIEGLDLQSIRLPLLLWSENENQAWVPDGMKRVRKYQRISSIVSDVLELYAKRLANGRGESTKKARVTAVWSPMGGVGKTTTALAFAEGKALEGKQVLYLDMEPFSSARVYFAETGRSISAVFEMIETGEGNIGMLVRSVRQQDNGSGISYFCRPENYDDMNILTAENIAALIDACAELTDELVIDLSCSCDERTLKVFELADMVLLVTDASPTAQIKFSQFVAQHNVFQSIREKAVLVANKGAIISKPLVDNVINLPLVQSPNAVTIYKTLHFNIPKDTQRPELNV